MKSLYIIGNAESEFSRPCRISESLKLKSTERIWATLTSDRLNDFKKEIEVEFGAYKTSEGHYNRSAQVLIHYLLSAAWKDTLQGLSFTLDIDECGHKGFTTSFIRREKPKMLQE